MNIASPESQIGRVHWLDGVCLGAPPCPVCGFVGPQPLVLETVALTQEQTLIQLVQCSDCGCRYWSDLTSYEYEGQGEHAWSTTFYLEQGAGIDALIEPISRLAPLGVESCLELGCGFGFSLDAARRLFGWRVVGADPSPLARAGRTALALDIRHIYADEKTELGGPFDLVYGSEVIEHVADPLAFLRICRAQLAPGGVLALSTPDGESVRPGVSNATLLPILSPGHHLVLFTAQSLERAVRAAGFAWTSVVARQNGLVIYAADRPLPIDVSAKLDRTAYRSYLETALAQPEAPPSLRTGLRYRLLKELVNAGELEAGLRIFEKVSEDCAARFGMTPGPDTAAAFCKVVDAADDRAAVRAPFCLPGILFFRGVIALNGSAETAGEGAPWFDAAAQAAGAFRGLYQRFGIDDGETEMLERQATELALMSLCHSDPREALVRLPGLLATHVGLARRIGSRFIDLGNIESARDCARISGDDTLAALVDGLGHLLSGANEEAHQAFTRASADGDLAARALAFDVLALSAFAPQAAIALARKISSAEANAFRPLFLRLVDHGHLAHASEILPAVDAFEDWEVNGRRALLFLLHAGQPELAADLFEAAFADAQGKASDDDLWRLKYHALMARIRAADVPAAVRVAREIFAAGESVPASVREAVEALLADHPAIRRGLSVG